MWKKIRFGKSFPILYDTVEEVLEYNTLYIRKVSESKARGWKAALGTDVGLAALVMKAKSSICVCQ